MAKKAQSGHVNSRKTATEDLFDRDSTPDQHIRERVDESGQLTGRSSEELFLQNIQAGKRELPESEKWAEDEFSQPEQTENPAVVTEKFTHGDENRSSVTRPVNDPSDGLALELISTATVDEDGNKSISFAAADVDGTVSTVASAEHGSVSLTDGQISYLPDADFHGSDTLTVTTTDDDGASVTRMVAVTVNDINDAPSLELISTATVDEDGNKSISFTAADVDGTVSTVASAEHGSVSLTDGQISYLPDADFHGSDTLTVTTTDDDGASVTRMVAVTVNDINDAPSLELISTATVDEDGNKSISFTAADVDGTVSTVASAEHGSVSLTDGQISYLPDADFHGSDTLTVTTTDDDGASVTRMVAVTVNDINDAPSLELISTATVDEDGNKSISFTAADVDGTVSTVASAEHGSVSLTDGQISYVPDADFHGSDTLTVTTTDDDGASVTRMVAVTVNDINDAPIDIIFSEDSVDENAASGTVVATLSADDVDAGESFTYEIVGASDQFIIDGNQILVREGADLDYESNSSHELRVRVTDSRGGSFEEDVTIQVNDVNEKPPGITLGGTNDGDHLVGTDGDDFFDGNRGNDTLEGGAGDDTFKVYGDAGTDQYDGGEGHDTIQGTRSNDTIRVTDNLDNLNSIEAIDGGDGYDTLQAGSGDDTLDFSASPSLSNIEEIDGGYGDDHIIGTSGDDYIEGNRGNDTLEGGAGDDTFKVYGDAGTDQYDGGEGHDTIQGTRSNDTIRVTDNLDNLNSIEAIDGGDGYDTLQAGSGDDTLDFSASPSLSNIEEIDGGYGDDHIIGTSGDDHIEGNRGNDTLEGGAGDDTFKVYGDAGTDQYDGGEGHDTIQGTRSNDTIRVTDNLDNLNSIEAIDGGDGYDTLQAGSGDDTLDFSASAPLSNIEEIDGGYGDDHIIGTSGDDHIEGNRGNDTLEGGAGDDTFKVYGDAGTDQYDGGEGHDTIQGTRSNDTIRVTDNLGNLNSIEAIDGGDGYDTLQAGSGDDTLDFSASAPLSNIEEIDGGYGDDHIIGTSGDDHIEGNRGNDTLEGGAGDDTFKVYGDAGTDQYDGGEGHDTIQGTRSNDTIRVTDNLGNLNSIEAIDGGDGYDTLQAGSGDDTLDFSASAPLSNIEEIDGGYGDDHIIGTSGDDHIEGNRGNDTLEGGAGDDTFKVYGDAGTDQYDGGEGHDTIQGTRSNDTIRVTDNLGNLNSIEAIDGGDGYDTLQAGSGDDTLDFSASAPLSNIEEIDGGYGDDRIIGTSGDDHIEGNRGNDTLEGGAGDDVVSGGTGDDTYIFHAFDGQDAFHGGGGWTDAIELDTDAYAGTEYPDNPWTLTVNGELVGDEEIAAADGALALNPDTTGVITMADGSELIFDGIEEIKW